MQGNLSAWLVKHGLIHRSLGFDYQGIETLQIKPGDWHSIAVILYVYGYNYLRHTCSRRYHSDLAFMIIDDLNVFLFYFKRCACMFFVVLSVLADKMVLARKSHYYV